MRLMRSKSKNSTSLYVIESMYNNGVRTTRIVEKLGTVAELSKTHEDPIAWANKYIEELNLKEKELKRDVIVKYKQSKLIENRPSDLNKKNQNDYKRFISSTNVTKDGEVANKAVYRINDKAIADEEMYDGFYAVCTNLDDDAVAITKINHRRWEIEECFRIIACRIALSVCISLSPKLNPSLTTPFFVIY